MHPLPAPRCMDRECRGVAWHAFSPSNCVKTENDDGLQDTLFPQVNYSDRMKGGKAFQQPKSTITVCSRQHRPFSKRSQANLPEDGRKSVACTKFTGWGLSAGAIAASKHSRPPPSMHISQGVPNPRDAFYKLDGNERERGCCMKP